MELKPLVHNSITLRAKSLQSCLTLSGTMDCIGFLCSMGFSRQEYWSGLPLPSPEDLLDPWLSLVSPALAGRLFTTNTTWEAPYHLNFLKIAALEINYIFVSCVRVTVCTLFFFFPPTHMETASNFHPTVFFVYHFHGPVYRALPADCWGHCDPVIFSTSFLYLFLHETGENREPLRVLFSAVFLHVSLLIVQLVLSDVFDVYSPTTPFFPSWYSFLSV